MSESEGVTHNSSNHSFGVFLKYYKAALFNYDFLLFRGRLFPKEEHHILAMRNSGEEHLV